ncbi:MAG: beta-glucosidase [Clostridiales bacterium]|jgi:beta-glucosidase|nr:beta-glucosidase [Clostridiales bacterium]
MRTKLTDEVSIKTVISEMTLEEKMNLIITPYPCITYSIEDMNIPSMILADGATGVNGTHIILDHLMDLIEKMTNQQSQSSDSGSQTTNPWIEFQRLIAVEEEAAFKLAEMDSMKLEFLKFLKSRRNPSGRFISFPSGINIGACFNDDTAYRIGKSIGVEMRASNVDVCLGPNVDIIRDPLGGRNYEMYGEDPVLVGRTAAAFVQGMQSTGTAACAKHFIANNQETRRQTKDTHVSKRTLRELYAAGFERAVKDGGVKAVMSAYNAVNGEFSSYNKMILTEWLKEEWGFDGIVVSDWGAVTGNNDEAVAAGMDMVLHGPTPCDGTDILEAVASGKLNEDRVDDAVARILQLMLWQKQVKAENTDSYEQKALLKTAYETVVDGMVLLKNNNVLPVSKDKTVAFYGSNSKNMMECGSGSTYITTPLHGNIFDESINLGINALYEKMDEAEIVVYTAGAEGGENADRLSMDVDQKDKDKLPQVLKAAKEQGKQTIVILNVAGPVDMREWIEYADSILIVFVPGCMGGKAAADVLFGDATPCGRLPVSFPMKLADSPASPYPIGEVNDIYYSEGIFVGYRWYDHKEIDVQFPFGFGLSYTNFAIDVQEITEVWDLRRQDTMQVSIHVKNIGDKFGSEVLQLYMRNSAPRTQMPEKELKAYTKVYLNPGEKKIVKLTVKRDDLMVFDYERETIIPTGDYVVMIGLNSKKIISEQILTVVGVNPYVMDENSTLGEILSNAQALAILDSYIPNFAANLGDHVKLMSNEKIGPLLSRYLIRSIPDANELKIKMEKFFSELSNVNQGDT